MRSIERLVVICQGLTAPRGRGYVIKYMARKKSGKKFTETSLIVFTKVNRWNLCQHIARFFYVSDRSNEDLWRIIEGIEDNSKKQNGTK